ncbi:DMT family transporter [Vibrio nigripulchritudo]|uniref:DMT family transporter n=1 Tax=Vibrio nigripulchritudo TaxID=28173 RepID=UPI0003B19C95|nr:EamA family transporter [Vibrio nigripulchritudo]CCN71542.1 putative Permease of the drug/metabolite transporter (DMT) superfamily [Vibrio nigripulchritudo SFn118]
MSDTAAAKSSSTQYRQGVMFALAGTVMFSVKPVFIKLAYEYGGDATSIMSLRALSSLPLYIAILFWLCRSQESRTSLRTHGWQAALVGILGYYFAALLDILALEHISAQLERLVIFLFPSFVVAISWIFMKEKPKPGTITAILLGYLGVAFIVSHDMQQLGDKVWLGSLMAAGSALIFAVYLVLSKRIIGKMGSQLFNSVGMASAGLAIMGQHVYQGIELSTLSPQLIALGITLGVFCTVVPSYFMAAAMARLTPSVLSITSNIGPSITALFAITILNEAFTVYHAIGMMLVVFSVWRINRK